MSVQNESLEMKPADHKTEAPELEYKAASQDSLSMFFAAIGGAVLGMLATLLVLALINGGTLNFIHPERLEVMEANLARVSENVGAVSQNIDIVAQQVDEVRTGLADARSQADSALAQLGDQGESMVAMQSAVDTLAVTGERFDTFVVALEQALTSMDAVGAPAPLVSADAAVAPNSVAVLFFIDANGDGALNDNENVLVGPQVTVQDRLGQVVGAYASTDAGMLVEDLTPGEYTFLVDDTAGHTLASAPTVAVVIPEDGSTGQIVYFPASE
jgi:hypothetical protein